MSKDLPQPNSTDEIDLGQLFKLIGNMFDRLFKFIGSIFKKFFLAFIWLIFFIKKHLIKLVIAGAVGIGLGFFLEKTLQPVYKSAITVKQNYNTGENLYNSITYYNDLIKQKDTNTLKQVLEVKALNIGSITKFEISPLVNDNEEIKNYAKFIEDMDTTALKNIEYEVFRDNYKPHMYQYQQIAVKSKERNNFGQVFNKIISTVNDNSFFRKEQIKDSIQLENEKKSILNALKKSDTLLSVYQKAIVKAAENKNQFQSNITIIEEKSTRSTTKEFELYNTVLELNERLVEIDRELRDKQDIIQIISSKQDSGSVDDRKNFFGLLVGQKMFYGLCAMFIVFIALLALSFGKFIERYKDKI